MALRKGLTPNQEAFAANLAASMPLEKAYIAAGYDVGRESAARAASRLAKRTEIMDRVREIHDEKARVRAEGTKLAIEYSGITQARVATELSRLGFANMLDYMRVGPNGDPILDFANLTREQASALTEVTVDDYVDGRGENARDVRKVRFKLADKRAALMDIAKLFGWIVEKRENKIVDEFDSMTTEQIEAWLDERAEQRVRIMQRRLGQPPRLRTIRGGKDRGGGIGGGSDDAA